MLDEPAGVSGPDREHVADCPECLHRLAAVREHAVLVAAALSGEAGGEVDVAAAWHRLSTTTQAAPSVAPSRTDRSRRTGRLRELVRRPAIAALALGVVLTGAGAAAANDWLQIFRTEQIAPVSLTTSDLVALPDLDAYGALEVTGGGDVREVADAQAAAARTGLDVPEVETLPRGVTGEPVYQVGGKVSATFTFSADEAADAAAEAGEPLPPPPPALDGSQVRLDAGPGLAAVWSQPSGLPVLLVGRAVAPTAYSSGVEFSTVRDYLLSLPGLPDDVAAQLQTFSADGSTLPLPVPADEVATSSTRIDGVPATVLVTRDQAMAAVVWVDDGVVTVVAGALGADEVTSIAEDLQ